MIIFFILNLLTFFCTIKGTIKNVVDIQIHIIEILNKAYDYYDNTGT